MRKEKEWGRKEGKKEGGRDEGKEVDRGVERIHIMQGLKDHEENLGLLNKMVNR